MFFLRASTAIYYNLRLRLLRKSYSLCLRGRIFLYLNIRYRCIIKYKTRSLRNAINRYVINTFIINITMIMNYYWFFSQRLLRNTRNITFYNLCFMSRGYTGLLLFTWWHLIISFSCLFNNINCILFAFTSTWNSNRLVILCQINLTSRYFFRLYSFLLFRC